MKSYRLLLLGALFPLLLTGCQHEWYPFLYRPPLSQGNLINPTNFAQLRPGMNKAEVVNLVGEPILQTPLSANTWHYVYMLRKNGKTVQQKQVTLEFDRDTLLAIK